MGIPCDDVVQIRPPEAAGEPTVISINCPDKIGLGCDLCRVILFFGLNIVRGDGKWCYVVFWVVGRRGKLTRWGLLKKRLLSVCPSVFYHYQYSPHDMMAMDPKPQVFLLKFCCFDRNGLLHDVTQALCELELTILKVKVSTTPDGRVMDLFFITDTRELLHTRKRQEETCDQLKSILGNLMTSCEIEPMSSEITTYLQASPFLPPEISEEMFNLELPQEETEGSHYRSYVPIVTVDNSLSPSHSLIQIICQDHKGLLYDVTRTLKDYNVQLSYGRFYTTQKARCEIDLFVVQMDGKKILDNNKQKALCDRLRMEMYKPLRVAVVNRGPDTELFVANPVELSGKGRPRVFYDVTLALKMLHTQIFLLHSKRTSKMDHERLKDLVYVKYNRALFHIYNHRDVFDPISLTDIDDANEWLTGKFDDEETEEDIEALTGEELTWSTVARVSGVYERSYNIRDRARGKAKESSSRLTPITSENEDDGGDEVDEENYSIGDDNIDGENEAVLGQDDDDDDRD